MALTPLPALDRTSATFKTDLDTYFLTALPAFSSEANALQADVTAKQVLANAASAEATNQAALAANQVTLAANQVTLATLQASAAASSAITAGASLWVSGTTYAVGNARYSPINGQTYRRLTAGAGTTDPSADATNWQIINGLVSQNVQIPVNNLPAIRPSLDLDFANSQTVDPRITFARASTATRTNARGLIELVPAGVPRIDFDAVTGACRGLLIEEQRTNLLTYSEQFDNAAWAKTAYVVTPNATTAPDGTLTADLVAGDGVTNGAHTLGQSSTSVVGVAYAISVYLKAGVLTKYRLAGRFSANWATFPAGVFDLVAGTVSNTSGDKTPTIEPVGNGWYRCAIYGTCATATTIGMDGGPVVGTSNTYDGAANPGGIYLWGAQLEAGAFPTTYQPSTETFTGRASTATFYGSNGLIQTAASGVARMNYNPMNLTVQPKLLLEAAGTNLLTYSEQFDNAVWIKTNSTVTPNSVVAPDGTLTADKLVEATGLVSPRIAYNFTASPGTVYTESIYLKAGERTQCHIIFQDGVTVHAALLNLSSGAVSANVVPALSDASAITTLVHVGNGWYRASIARAAAGSTYQLSIRIYNGSDNYTGDGTSGLFIWGAQLEAGAFATSYIPTVASQVTRVADSSTSAQTTRVADVASMTGANFSSWYRQDEGSFVVGQSIAPVTNRTQMALSLSDGTVNNTMYLGKKYDSTTVVEFGITSGGVGQAFVLTTPATMSNSMLSGAYKLNDVALSTGAAASTDTSAVIPIGINILNIGRGAGQAINGHIRSLSYYPKRLTNAELQALSTQ